MRYLIMVTLGLYSSFLFAQIDLSKKTINIPRTLYLKEDSNAKVSEDYLSYAVKASFYFDGLEIKETNILDRKNPYSVLANMVQSYREKSFSKFLSLHDPQSEVVLKKLSDKEIAAQFDYMDGVKKFFISFALQLKEGVLVGLYLDEVNKIDFSYLKKTKDNYYLSSYEFGDDPTMYNLLSYAKARPKDPLKPVSIQYLKKIKLNSDKIEFKFKLNNSNSYVTLFNQEKKILVILQDNLINEKTKLFSDFDNRLKNIKTALAPSLIRDEGTMVQIYVVETNYPPVNVTNKLIQLSEPIQILFIP